MNNRNETSYILLLLFIFTGNDQFVFLFLDLMGFRIMEDFI